jgi:hypothetical protein
MREEPSLIDLAIRESYKKYGTNNVAASLRPSLISARRFKLSKEMSAFLADLSNAALMETQRKSGNVAAFNFIDNLRQLARLPHSITWIEYDCQARKQRSHEAYEIVQYSTTGKLSEIEEIVPIAGWLLETHPSIPTAFKMTEFNRPYPDRDLAVAFPFSTMWVTDDNTILPWHQLPWHNDGRRPSEIATGVLGYISPHIGITAAPGIERMSSKQLEGILLETIGEMRVMLSLLATINDLPVLLTEVRPSRGYMAGRNYHRYLHHNVINLQVPAARSLKTLAIRAMVVVRRKGHEVRGHWRDDWRHPLLKDCYHDWDCVNPKVLRCKFCNGRRLWIDAHHRGDDRLGFITHEYNVTKG